MRILHLTDHYLPVLGGIETHVAALARRQAARGADVTVLTSTPASADGRHSDDTGPVTVLRVASVLEGSRVDFTAYDVVHVHVSVVAPFSSLVTTRAARTGVPTVVTVHSLWDGLGPVPTLAASLAGLRRAPVLWTAVSAVAAQQVSARLPGRPPVAVLPNGVDLAARRRTPRRAPGEPVHLVSTMRVARRKRPLQLVEMLADLRRTAAAPVRLTVVGDGPLRPRLERLVERRGLADAVHVTGRLEPAEVVEVVAGADLYVAPAVLESFGIAALEARCVGLPVVGHSASGLTEFVTEGREGLLRGSDEAMVAALRDLVDDPGARHAMAEHNRTTPSSLTWANALDATDRAYAHAGAGIAVSAAAGR